jgi:hypothetical protein
VADPAAQYPDADFIQVRFAKLLLDELESADARDLDGSIGAAHYRLLQAWIAPILTRARPMRGLAQRHTGSNLCGPTQKIHHV